MRADEPCENEQALAIAQVVVKHLRSGVVERAWLSFADVASRTGIPEKTLEQYHRLGQMPRGVRIGRHRRFRVTDIDRWMASSGQETGH